MIKEKKSYTIDQLTEEGFRFVRDTGQYVIYSCGSDRAICEPTENDRYIVRGLYLVEKSIAGRDIRIMKVAQKYINHDEGITHFEHSDFSEIFRFECSIDANGMCGE